MPMSLRFLLLRQLLRCMGTKRLFRLPRQQLLDKAAKINAKRGFAVPTDRKHLYTDVPVGAHDHCLKIRRPGTHYRRAMLFLYGGGMILGPDAGDRKAACGLAFPCGMEVWMPWYPLCPAHSMADAVDMILSTYRLMLREYAPQDICFCGFSSGASLAISTCLHNLRQAEPLPNPACILASSPGGVPHCEEERHRMTALNRVDLMVDIAFLDTMQDILGGGQPLPDYLQFPCTADYTGMPPIHFWWGSDEVLYAEAPYYRAACEKAGVPHTVEIGQGLCHCYPMLDCYPEGRAAQAQMRRYLCSR